VVAKGVVAKASVSGKSDFGFLNFAGSLHVMLMPELCRKLKPSDYVKKEVKVSGELISVKGGNFRIEVSDDSQIELVDQES